MLPGPGRKVSSISEGVVWVCASRLGTLFSLDLKKQKKKTKKTKKKKTTKTSHVGDATMFGAFRRLWQFTRSVAREIGKQRRPPPSQRPRRKRLRRRRTRTVGGGGDGFPGWGGFGCFCVFFFLRFFEVSIFSGGGFLAVFLSSDS